MALGKAAMANLENIWKDKDVTIATNERPVNVLVFLAPMYMRVVDHQTEGMETNRQLQKVVLEEEATNIIGGQ